MNRAPGTKAERESIAALGLALKRLLARAALADKLWNELVSDAQRGVAAIEPVTALHAARINADVFYRKTPEKVQSQGYVIADIDAADQNLVKKIRDVVYRAQKDHRLRKYISDTTWEKVESL